MSYSNVDINLTQIATDDAHYKDKIAGVINHWYDSDTNRKQERAATWSQSIHFFAGDQWIRYNFKEHRFDTIPYTDNQRNVDRPVTNFCLKWTIVNVASFTDRPIIIVDPNSKEPKDKEAARAGRIILDYMYGDQNKNDSYYEAALWNAICGTVFRKSIKEETTDFLLGSEEKREYLYKPSHEIVAPYRLAFDGLARRWEDIDTIMDTSIRRVDWIKKKFGFKGNGFTGDADLVTEEKISNNVMQLYEGIKEVIEGGSYANIGSRTGGMELKNSAVLKEVYSKPNKYWPRGRYIVVANGFTLFDSYLMEGGGRSPTYYLDGEIWHPYTYCQYWKTPGTLWGLSLMQHLVPLQRRINSIDALMAYNRKTIATGYWLIPNGSNTPDEYMIGVPGLNIPYDPDPTGAKPELLPGQPLPAQVIQERELLIANGDELSLAGDIRSGKNPRGVNTLGQLQILREEGETAKSKQIEAWERFIEKSEQLDLLQFQECYKVSNLKTVKKLTSISDEMSEDDWKQFIGSDLRDNANIRIEPGSTIRSSKILRQNMILRLAQNGLLGEIVADPVVHKKFLDEFGMANMYTESNVDMKNAEYEIEQMKQGKYPPILDVYNPDIHLLVLTKYMKEPKFLELPENVRLLFDQRKNAYIDMLRAGPIQPDVSEETLKAGEAPEVIDINKNFTDAGMLGG